MPVSFPKVLRNSSMASQWHRFSHMSISKALCGHAWLKHHTQAKVECRPPRLYIVRMSDGSPVNNWGGLDSDWPKTNKCLLLQGRLMSHEMIMSLQLGKVETEKPLKEIFKTINILYQHLYHVNIYRILNLYNRSSIFDIFSYFNNEQCYFM